MDARQDELDRRINDFAKRSFRDIADGDYVAARLACRNGLMPQFLWSAQQAIEKYLKYILLVNRISSKGVGHDIKAAFGLTEKLSFKLSLSERSRRFFDHVATCGEYRYLEISYFVVGHSLVDLDLAVWEIRRYAQVLDVFGKTLPNEENLMLAEAWHALRESERNPPRPFRLRNGLLEAIVDDKRNPARAALVWQNPCFGSRARKRIRAKQYINAQNAPLYLFPDMLEEIEKLVWIPKRVQAAYREHLARISANPSERP